MNLLLLTATVATIKPVVRNGGSIKYFFQFQVDTSFVDSDGNTVEKLGYMNASGTPRIKDRDRWSVIEVGDELYVKASLNFDLDGQVFLTVYDLGIAFHPEEETQIEMMRLPTCQTL